MGLIFLLTNSTAKVFENNLCYCQHLDHCTMTAPCFWSIEKSPQNASILISHTEQNPMDIDYLRTLYCVVQHLLQPLRTTSWCWKLNVLKDWKALWGKHFRVTFPQIIRTVWYSRSLNALETHYKLAGNGEKQLSQFTRKWKSLLT
jgi:hypothetical protein